MYKGQTSIVSQNIERQLCTSSINAREYRRCNQKLTIHRNWQRKTKTNKTKYVLDTTIHKQSQIT